MMAQDLLNILGWKKEDLLNLQFIAYSYVKQGKYDIALTLLETLEVLDSNDLYTLQTLGAIYIEMKKPEKALEFLLKALSLDPQNEMILFNKTQALISMGSKAEALEDCKLLTNAKNPHIKRKIDAYLLSQQIA